MKTFDEIAAVNVSAQVEKKGKLSYLSWAYAWAEIKKIDPQAQSTVYENRDGWNYHTDGKTCWVKTGVTVNGLEHIEYLPVMDDRNQSIPADKVTSWHVNKAIQRSITKAIARHGLGLYIYAGEDLPDDNAEPPKPPQATELTPEQQAAKDRAGKAADRLGMTPTQRKSAYDRHGGDFVKLAEELEGKAIAKECAADEQAIIDQATANAVKAVDGTVVR
jgi:hypothetical protein